MAPTSAPRIAPVVPPTASASPAMPPAMPSVASMPTPPPVARGPSAVPTMQPLSPVIPPVAPAARPPSVPTLAPAGARPPGPPAARPVPTVGPVTPPPVAPRPPTPPAISATPPPVLAVGQVVPPIAPAAPPPPRPGNRPTTSLPALAPAGSPRPPTPPPVAPPRPPAASAPPPPPAAAGGPALSPEQLVDLESRCAKLDQTDYFELLGLERTAAPGDIKKAFYKESRVYHPDRFFQLESKALKDQVNELYKRVTEAYYVLRDDTKRKKYLSDIAGPDRAQKLRFTDASESETKAAAKKEQEEQIGTHPKGRQFYTQAQKDLESGNPSAAERNLKMALTYEPSNARYKEALAEAQKQTADKSKGDSSFKIR
ncbi:J domain-containing protein [Corallococcus coralloides]|uniref:J domain-containing protein n=1 Tax=Corallococcus coralloides TaxID=184914 RepID=UPI001ED9084D|nr:DnaJ domain-containing protein [Corallococcus coralloides]